MANTSTSYGSEDTMWATASSGADTLAMMRGQIFNALVMDSGQDRLDIQNFTAKAQGLQPSLAVFLVDEWGDELVTGLEELGHELTMLEECAMLAVEPDSCLSIARS